MTRFEKWLNTILGWFTPFCSPILNWLAAMYAEFALMVMRTLEKEYAPKLTPALDKAEATGKVPPELQGIIDEMKNPSSPIGAFLGQAAAGGATGGLISSTLGPFLLLLQYELQRLANQYRFDPLTALAIILRRPDLQPLAESDMRDQGITDERRQALFDAALTRLKEDDYVTLRRRFGWTKLEYEAAMYQLGYTPDRAEDYYKASEYFPGASDLVRFAVREVYSPDIVAKFRTDEGLPADFIAEAAKAGLPDTQARNYWRAHWELPSITQGFEMLHRGVITQDELELLLRTQDVMPFWRDMLVKISYSPYTRVDVRRMHKIGVLSREDVVQSYKDLGYDADKAELMTEFTLKYNEAEDRQLTKTDIVSSYFKNIIGRVPAEEMLAELGYTPEDIDILLKGPPPAEEEAERRLTLSQLRELYDNKLRPKSQITAYLQALGYTADTIQAIYDIWDWNPPPEDQVKSRELTLSQLQKLYQTGLRPKAQVTGFLAALGYDATEIAALYDIWDWQEPVEEKEKARDLTLTNVKDLYQTGLRSLAQVTEWLRVMGYSDDEINALLELWNWTKPASTKTPSRTDLDRFLTDGVIDLQTWVDEYRGLGYDDRYVQWYYAELLARAAAE